MIVPGVHQHVLHQQIPTKHGGVEAQTFPPRTQKHLQLPPRLCRRWCFSAYPGLQSDHRDWAPIPGKKGVSNLHLALFGKDKSMVLQQ